MDFIVSAANTNSFTIGTVLTVTFMLLAVAGIFAVVCLAARYSGTEKARAVSVGGMNPLYVLGIVGIIGLVARLLFVFIINGYGPDYSASYAVANSVRVNSGFGTYTENYLGTGPLLGYIYAAFGGMGIALNLSKDALWMQFFIKLPYILADIAAFALLYYAVSKYVNRYVGLAVSSVYFLSPVFFMTSSVWGSPVSLYALALLLIGYFLLSKNAFGMVCATAAGLLLDVSFVFVAVIVAAYLLYLLTVAIIETVKTRPSLDTIARDATLSNVYYIPICLLLGFMGIYLISLPAYYPDGVGTIGAVYKELFVSPLDFNSSDSAFMYFSRNGLGIFTLFVQNNQLIGNRFPKLLYSGIILALALAFMLLMFLSKRNRANLLLVLSFVWTTVSVYFVGSTELSIVPALLLLLLAFSVIKDKRLLHVFAILSLTVTLNAMLVMFGGEQFGMSLVADRFLMNEDGLLNIFSILLSVITVLAHLFFAVVTIDVSLTKHRVVFSTGEDSGIGECIRNWYRG